MQQHVYLVYRIKYTIFDSTIVTKDCYDTLAEAKKNAKFGWSIKRIKLKSKIQGY